MSDINTGEEYFVTQPLPDELGIYSYPLYLYLRFAPGAEKYVENLEKVRSLIPDMLEKAADHYPLFSPYWGKEMLPFLDK